MLCYVSAVIAILVSIGVKEYVRPVAVAGLTRVRMSVGSPPPRYPAVVGTCKT